MVINGTIYKLTNTLTQNTYIGATEHFKNRMRTHRCKYNGSSSRILYDMSGNVSCVKLYEQQFLNRQCMESLEQKLIQYEYRFNKQHCVNSASRRNPILQRFINYVRKTEANNRGHRNNPQYWTNYFVGKHNQHRENLHTCAICDQTMKILSLKSHNKTKGHKSRCRRLRELGLNPVEYKIKIEGDGITLVVK